MKRIAALAFALLGIAAPAASADGGIDDIEITVAAEPESVRPGQEFTLSIFMDMPWEIGVHVPRYMRRAGVDAGRAAASA